MIYTYEKDPVNSNEQKGVIIFIHGAWHSSWAWENFIEYFTAKNYKCIAPDLRGHGNSEIDRSLRWCSLFDYANDIRSVIEKLDTKPIVIAHSMAGAVMMKYLKIYDKETKIDEIILLAPALRGPIWKLSFKLLFNHTWVFLKTLFTLDLGKVVENRELVDKLLFHEQTPEETKQSTFNKLQSESFRAYIGMLLNSSVTNDVRKMSIISAENDYMFNSYDYEAIANDLEIDHYSIKDVAHNLILDSKWQKVASKIDFIISK